MQPKHYLQFSFLHSRYKEFRFVPGSKETGMQQFACFHLKMNGFLSPDKED